jgi:hypothetical protein
MNESLKLLEEISKEQFLAAWADEDRASGHPDSYMEERRKEHAAFEGLKYYLATFTMHGLAHLVVGHHVHPAGRTRARPGGELLETVVSRYWSEIRNGQTDDCLDRFQRIRGELNSVVQVSGDLLKADYSLGRVFVSGYMAMPGNGYRDHGNDALYAGNFHRFVGYGLWVKEYSYRPAKVYFCTWPRAD